MNLKLIWLHIWSQKAKIGSALGLIAAYVINNPNDAIVQFFIKQFPKFGWTLMALSTFLVGSGLFKRDKEVKREIKLETDPLFDQRSSKVESATVYEGKDKIVVQKDKDF